jgi:hypothetical protein
MSYWIYIVPSLTIIVSLKYLMLQAFFHDVRLGFLWLASFILGTASTVFPKPISMIVIGLAAIIYLVFFFVFIYRYFSKAFVYLPLIVIVISGSVLVCGVLNT